MRTSRHSGAACWLALALIGVLELATASHAGVGSRAGTIAFLSGADRSGLFAIEADGSGLRRLTPSGLDVSSFEWAPDGSRIAYLDGGGAPRLVRPDGTGRELLAAPSRLRSPWVLSWSPDGKAIAVEALDPGTPVRRHNSMVRLEDRRHSDRRRRAAASPVGGVACDFETGDAESLDWSPQGGEITYGDGGREEWIVRTDGSKPRPLFRSPPRLLRPLGYPIWSPDATHIGFVASVQHGEGRHVDLPVAVRDRYDAIYVADADGSNLHLVTRHAYNEYGFDWSPDGKSILYGRAQRKGIYVIDADGRNNHRVTRDSPRPTEFGALTWAPDGRSIAYATDRTGNGDIYVIDANSHNKVRLTNTAADDIDPSWQPK